MDEEKEYEVESIIQAVVVNEGKRGKKKLAWKYRVRWKGYGVDDDTWEPVESFEGSENIINTFWGRASTGGRDYHDIRAFKAGEEFLPVGPPRRKQKALGSDTGDSLKNESSNHHTPVASSPENEKRKRDITSSDSLEGRPHKRTREHASDLTHQLPSSSRKVTSQFASGSKGGASPSTAPATNTSTPTRSRRGLPRNSFTDEVIPASDGEADDMSISISRAGGTEIESVTRLDNTHLLHLSEPNKVVRSSSQVFAELISPGDEDISIMDQTDSRRQIVEERSRTNVPSHRSRAANPLVKMVEPPSVPDVEKAISVKARLLKGMTALSPPAPDTPRLRSGRSAQASGSRPGPGRSSTGFVPKRAPKNKSSILTVEKGTLKSVKGTYSKPTQSRSAQRVLREDSGEEDSSLWGGGAEAEVEVEVESSHSNSQAPPTAEELLDLAGLDAQNAEALPDFEDDLPSSTSIQIQQPNSQLPAVQVAGPVQPPQAAAETDPLPLPQTEVKSALQQSLDLAKDKLFPSGASDVLSSLGAVWKRSTIFGPLGLGSEARATSPKTLPESAQSTPFFLNLDSSISVPLTLLTTPLSPSIDLGMSQGGPAGKFYQPQSAILLLDTLRTGGSSARISLRANATEDQQDHFQRFHSRLRSGDLFVAMAGVEIFAFCSAGNNLISQRLNLPSSLLGNPEDLLVSRVIIENYSAYANAALHADSRRWSQYISTT